MYRGTNLCKVYFVSDITVYILLLHLILDDVQHVLAHLVEICFCSFTNTCADSNLIPTGSVNGFEISMQQ